jgi:hypothetical protein
MLINAPRRDGLTARQKKPGDAGHAGFKRREIRKIIVDNAASGCRLTTLQEKFESQKSGLGNGRGRCGSGLYGTEPEVGILINEFPIVEVMGAVAGEGQTNDSIDHVEGGGT